MRRITAPIALLVATMTATAANPPLGHAVNDSVEVAAAFLDAAAVKQATGSDFSATYTVIEVTLTPKDGKSLVVDPDHFLLRVESSSDSSGPMSAAQVLGAGGLVLHKERQQVIGITRTEPAYTGATAVEGSASPVAVDALQQKMLPARNTTAPVTGLLFFPIAKKKARDLDLVYTTPSGKLHIAFH